MGWILLHTSRQPRTVALPEVERSQLLFRDGRWFQLPQTNLFTGLMVERYPGGALSARSAVSNGVLNGVSEGWYTNGQIQIREYYVNSLAHGLRQKWHANGQLKSEGTIIQGKLEGLFQSWHENGQLAERIEMKNGAPEGEAWAFYSSGCVKAETRVQAGKVLNQRLWNDGERPPTGTKADSPQVSRLN